MNIRRRYLGSQATCRIDTRALSPNKADAELKAEIRSEGTANRPCSFPLGSSLSADKSDLLHSPPLAILLYFNALYRVRIEIWLHKLRQRVAGKSVVERDRIRLKLLRYDVANQGVLKGMICILPLPLFWKLAHKRIGQAVHAIPNFTILFDETIEPIIVGSREVFHESRVTQCQSTSQFVGSANVHHTLSKSKMPPGWMPPAQQPKSWRYGRDTQSGETSRAAIFMLRARIARRGPCLVVMRLRGEMTSKLTAARSNAAVPLSTPAA